MLLGITRSTVIEIAEKELGALSTERQVDRSELYAADEVFLTGTAAHITPVVEIDRRVIGDGNVGPVTRRLANTYVDIIKGKDERYSSWCTPVYSKANL